MDTVYIKKKSSFSEVNSFYRKSDGAWYNITQQQFLVYLGQSVSFFGGDVSTDKFEIAAPSTLVAETCQCLSLYNDHALVSGVVWSIVSGSTYATINNSGLVTILSTADNSPIIIHAEYGAFVANHEMTVTYKAGSASETTTEVVVDESGNSTTTVTTVTENEDGSSYVEETKTVTDENGVVIGSTETNVETNADGSFSGSTTSYDSEGNPTETTNQSGDVDGNISTQEIEYDEDGEPVVTGYNIDTSNGSGEKTFNGDGVNTEYYAFDMTHGFVVHIHFYFNFKNQPAGQNENHHNILTMKRASPQPWYGFQLRQTSTNAYIILGTQFSSGSNTNTNISGATTSSANTVEYDLTITYNPTAASNKFVCRNNLTGANIFTKNDVFPDIDELKYLKVTIGCAMDPNGEPYRYSNITLLDFNITRT